MPAALDEPVCFKLRIMVPVQIGMMGLLRWLPQRQAFSVPIRTIATDIRMLRCCAISGHTVLCKRISKPDFQSKFYWSVEVEKMTFDEVAAGETYIAGTDSGYRRYIRTAQRITEAGNR